LRDHNESLSDLLLDWYDANARVLPWRVAPADGIAGKRADPYFVWLSEIMLQQTTVAAVIPYFLKFSETWPSVRHLASAKDAQVMAAWAGLGYYARARNLLKCARLVAQQHDGQFPEDVKPLQKLPGIGPYTAAAIAAIAFDRPAVVVDGNVERVMARYYAVKTALPAAKPQLQNLAAGLTPDIRAGDYAQAIMDLGATVCTPKSPNCSACPWRTGCRALALKSCADFPVRRAKQAKPTRLGIVWVARRQDNAFLLERRPNKGLLGGMLGWPGKGWCENSINAPPVKADWQVLPEKVRHTFTHFHLHLEVRTAVVPVGATPGQGEFIKSNGFDANELPTVMRKVYEMACSSGRL